MFGYAPKLSDAIITGMIFVGLLLLSARTVQPDFARAFNAGAVIFGILFLVVIGLMALEGLNRRVETMTEFGRMLATLDDEGRALMAFEFPHMRYRMKHGVVREFFDDTNVPMETFRLFLRLSNTKQISPRRDWCTKEKPEWAWMEIFDYLKENDFIIPDSAAGSHSWLWNGNAWDHLKAYWGAGLHVPEMKNMQVYTTAAPPAEDV